MSSILENRDYQQPQINKVGEHVVDEECIVR